MKTGNILELPSRICKRSELFLNLAMEAIEDGIDRRAKDIVLAFEVEVNCSIGDARPGGDRTYRRAKVAIFSNDLNRRIQDALILIPSAGESSWARRLSGAVRVTVLFALQCSLDLETSSAATLKKRHDFAKTHNCHVKLR